MKITRFFGSRNSLHYSNPFRPDFVSTIDDYTVEVKQACLYLNSVFGNMYITPIKYKIKRKLVKKENGFFKIKKEVVEKRLIRYGTHTMVSSKYIMGQISKRFIKFGINKESLDKIIDEIQKYYRGYEE